MDKHVNWDKIAEKWSQLGGEVKKQWGSLTDEELLEVNGNREMLSGKIQAKYSIAQAQANRQIDKWADKLKV